MFHKSLTAAAAGVLMAACATGAIAGPTNNVVYSNDFSNGAGPEWSNNYTSNTPSGEAFLGQFGNGTDTLTLTNLAPHTSATVDFDLYVIQTMDGNGPYGGGADPWGLTENGNSLVYTTFANYPGDTQSYPSNYDPTNTVNNPDQTGATAVDTLGYDNYGDATYHLTYTFTDSSPTLALAFTSDQNQGVGDEGWGLDNVVVSTDTVPGGATAVPEPSTWAAFAISGLSIMGLMLAARKRKLTA